MTEFLKHDVDPNLVHTWLKGWAQARFLPAPEPYHSSFKVEVGWAEHRRRYVFPHLNNFFRELANTINEPYIFLKVCASTEEMRAMLPQKWHIMAPAFMMRYTTSVKMTTADLPTGYNITVSRSPQVAVVEIKDDEGSIAARGGIVFKDGYGIYDQIATDAAHRRKGLASVVMKTLQELGFEQKIHEGILVATPEGKWLYESLGWKMYSPYSTAVILPA